MAASDPLRTIAAPHCTLAGAGPSGEPTAALLDLLVGLEPTLLLVGIPLNMDGSEGEMATECRRFAARLRALTGAEVIERDERLTSFEAEELLREMDLPRRKKRDRGLLDMLAATLILREFLEES